MRYISVLLLLTTLNFTSLGQAYEDKITKQVCECMSEVDPDATSDEFKLQIGLCMIKAADNYKKKLKKDYGIDLNQLNRETGEKLGSVLMTRVLDQCPDTFQKLMTVAKDDSEDIPEEAKVPLVVEKEIEGTVTKVTDEQFIVFSIKEESGKVSKIYWMNPVRTEVNLSQSQTLIGKNVFISYTEAEYFDARIGEYRKYKIMASFETID